MRSKKIKEALDEKYSYQIDENNVVHLFRGEEDCQKYLTNSLISAIFKIEALKKKNEDLKKQTDCYKAFESHYDEIEEDAKAIVKENEDLKEKNTELKTKKIPQLERKIASIRGCHSVAVKKLNARIEQVERLKKENAELREQVEQMKCCENCQSVFDANGFCYLYKDGKCVDHSEWVKKEYNLVKKEKNNE